MSRPLWNFTPSRSVISHTLRSASGSQPVASSGSTSIRSFTYPRPLKALRVLMSSR
ncbi:hypothetical protein D3C83_305470 [compost metagenome]